MKKIAKGRNTLKVTEAARARKLARTAKARRSARSTVAGRAAQTTMAAAIGAGILLQGGHAPQGIDASSAVLQVAYVAVSDPGDESGTDSDEEGGDSASGADSTDGGGSPGADRPDTERDEPEATEGSAGEASSDDDGSDGEHQGRSEPERPGTTASQDPDAATPTTKSAPATPVRASDRGTISEVPAEPAGPAATPPSAGATVAAVVGRAAGQPSSAAPARATIGTTPTSAVAAVTPTSQPAAVRARSGSVIATRVTEAISHNTLTRLALALVGAPVRPGTAPRPLAPSAPSSALLVAQWALFRRGENSLFNRSPVVNTTSTPSASTGEVVGSVNATDPDGDRLTYEVAPVDQPLHGSVVVRPDGTWTYRPDPAWARTGGTDTFVVTVRDNNPKAPGFGQYTGIARQALALRNPSLADRLFGAHTVRVPITVTVAPTNVAPTPPASTPAPSSVDGATGTVIGGLGVTDPDGDALTYTGPAGTTTKGGTVIVDPATGTYTYTPSATARHAAASTSASAADRVDSFTVLVSDGRGTPVPIVVTVPISPVNSAPEAPSVLPAPVLFEGGTVTGRLGLVDPDRDPLSYVGPSGPNAKGGTVSVDPLSGSYTYTPSATARHAAASDTAGPDDRTDSFTILVSDGHGATVPVTITVPISPLNSAPTTPSTTPAPTSVDTSTGTVVGGLGAADPDGDALTYSGPAGTTAKGGTVNVDNVTGQYTYTPGAAARHAAAAVGAGPAAQVDRFTVVVDDGHGASVPVIVTVPITPVNIAPSAPGLPAPTVSSSGRVTGDLGAADPDGDTLSFAGPTGTTAKGGTVSVDRATGRYTYIPSAAARHAAAAEAATAADKVDTFTVLVSDGHGATVPIVVTVPVTPANSSPIRSTNVAGTVDEIAGVVTGSTGALDADGDRLTYTGPTSTTAKGGTVVVDPSTGAYTYTPSAAARHAAARPGAPFGDKRDSFTVVVSDGHGGRVEVVHTVAVSPANAAPVAGTPTIGAADPTTGAVTGVLGVTDADGDTLTWSTTKKPQRGSVTVDAATGRYTYTPTGSARLTAANSGGPVTDTFTLSAADGYGGSVPVTVTVVVDPHIPSTNTVLDTVSVGRYSLPSDAVLLPDGSRAYVANSDGTVTVIDMADGAVSATIPVASGSRQVEMSADGTRAYVVAQDGTLSVIDTATDTVVSTVPLHVRPSDVLLSPDGRRLYVTDFAGSSGNDRMVIFDTQTGAVTSSPSLGRVARAMALSPDGRRLSVLSITEVGWTTSVLDAASGEIISQTDLNGSSFSDLVVSPDGTRAYAAESNYAYIQVIDTADGKLLEAIPIATTNGSSKRLALSGDGRRLYVADGRTARVTVIDTVSNGTVAIIPTGVSSDFPVSTVVLSPDGSRLYVNNGVEGTVRVIDTATNTVVAIIPVGTGPGAPAVSADGTRVVVPNSNGGTATIVYTGPGSSSLA